MQGAQCCASSSRRQRRFQSTRIHRSSIPRRCQGLAPGTALEDATRKPTRSFVSPPEGIQGQARRAAVRSQDYHSRSAARVSDLAPPEQNLHQRHSSNRVRQLGDVHLYEIPRRPDNRLSSPNSARHFIGLVCKVKNRRPSREEHSRAFLENRAPKKKARQPSRIHLPRRHYPQATSD
ncbi:hypothetical protein Trydic_g22432 [Trypoxylus dichotomus]